MSETRTKIAAGFTLLALGGLAGVALSAESGSATGTAATAAPVEVRTQVIRRTVHVIRREKPKRSKPVKAAVSAAPIPAVVAAPPATARVVSAPPQKQRPAAPVRTRTSGSGGSGSGEREDHGDDNGSEGRDD